MCLRSKLRGKGGGRRAGTENGAIVGGWWRRRRRWTRWISKPWRNTKTWPADFVDRDGGNAKECRKESDIDNIDEAYIRWCNPPGRFVPWRALVPAWGLVEFEKKGGGEDGKERREEERGGKVSERGGKGSGR